MAKSVDILNPYDGSVIETVQEAGVYTRDLNRVLLATQKLNVGGVKDSGVGREGPRFTIEEMTTLRMDVMSMGV